MQALGGSGVGKLTQTAGTRIRQILGGAGGLFTSVVNFRYTASTTAHTGTLMRDCANGLAASALAAAGTALVIDRAVLDGDGNVPASLDILVVRLNTGEWHMSTISAWTAGTKTFTLNTAIPTAKSVLKGAPIYFYGVQGDTFHLANTFTLTASATTNFPVADTAREVVLLRGRSPGAPVLFDSDNATAAGTLEYANWNYAKR